jgi:hypothetical protein
MVVIAALRPGQAFSLVQPTSVETNPVSDSVLATIVTQNDSLALMVLWRGSHHWFLKGSSHGASGGGGQNGVVSASLQFGGRTLDLTFDKPRRQLSIQGKSQPISDDSNVVLVDETDAASGPRVVKMLSIPAEARAVDPRQGSLAPFFKRSKELVSFLQCPAGQGAAREMPFAKIVCKDL